MEENKITILYKFWMVILVLSMNSSAAQDQTKLSRDDFEGIPLEEIILHTDRDLYLAGESIWFNSTASIRNGGTGSPLSKVLYVELAGLDNKVFLQLKFKLTGGMCSGRLIIPEEAPTGYYVLRAYTMYLRNFSPEYYCNAGLLVVNPEIPQTGNQEEETVELAVEGGVPVLGCKTNASLKIPGHLMKKIRSIQLVDKDGADFREITVHDNGIGIFPFIPDQPGEYFVKINLGEDDSLLVQLPEVVREGISVVTHQVAGGLEVEINLSLPAGKENERCRLMLVDRAFNTVYEKEVTIEIKESSYIIPAGRLPYGLGYIVLLTEGGNPVCINPVFVYRESQRLDSPGLAKHEFTRREKVELDLALPARVADSVLMMTVSVVKDGTFAGEFNPIPEHVILNPFLLESYLSAHDCSSPALKEQVKSALVLYGPVAAERYQQSRNRPDVEHLYVPEIRDVSVSGYLVDRKTREPIDNIQVFASVLFDDFQLHNTRTKEDGSFGFSLNHLTGRKNLYIFPDIEDEREHELLIHNDFSTEFVETRPCLPVIDTASIRLLEELYLNHQVTNEFHNGTPAREYEIKKLAPWFGVDMISVKLADYIELASFREVINEIVPNVRLKVSNDQYRFAVFNEKSQSVYENPLVMIDHLPVTDINSLVTIHPSLIEKVEVMNQPYMLGNYTIWGMIMITTKTDNFAGIELSGESAFLNYQALTATESLSQVNFEDKNMENASVPFFNSVLLFEKFRIDDPIPGKLSFFTSDHTSGYSVVVRGMMRNGTPFMSIEGFRVLDK